MSRYVIRYNSIESQYYIVIIIIVLIITSNNNVIRYNILLLLVDCVWDAFGEWTDCSADCGTGTQTRTRTQATTAEHGGAACVGDATETQNCNTHHCPGT